MRKLAIGVLAHVDAGKTTLSEALLYHCGTIRSLGRVDHKDSYLDGEEIETPSLNEQISYCKELVKDLIEEKGEYVALRVARGIVTKFFDGFPKAKKLKMRLSTELNTYDDLKNIINDYLEEISI